MLLAGWRTGRTRALQPRDRFAPALVLVVRNVALAKVIVVTFLGRVGLAVFIAT